MKKSQPKKTTTGKKREIKVSSEELLAHMQAYFLDYGRFPTHNQIAKDFSITRQWVSQLIGRLLEADKVRYSADTDIIKPNTKPKYDYRKVCLDLGLNMIEAERNRKINIKK